MASAFVYRIRGGGPLGGDGLRGGGPRGGQLVGRGRRGEKIVMGIAVPFRPRHVRAAGDASGGVQVGSCGLLDDAMTTSTFGSALFGSPKVSWLLNRRSDATGCSPEVSPDG